MFCIVRSVRASDLCNVLLFKPFVCFAELICSLYSDFVPGITVCV